MTALPEANGENPEMAVLVDLLTTLSSQERAQIISELSKEQRYTIAHLSFNWLVPEHPREDLSL